MEQSDDAIEQSQLLEQLEDWLKNPLDLNTASARELLLIPGFPEIGVKSILRFREKQGKLRSPEQAKGLITDDDELWRWISQFVTVRTKRVKLKLQMDGRVRLSLTQEKARGFLKEKFSGNPVRLYQRYRIRSPGSFQFGVLTEKDPGELSYRDHAVLNLMYHWQRWSSRFIFGNYTLNLGMGLMVWSPFTVSKNSAPFYAVMRNDRVIRPYLSSYEADYFQGAAFHAAPGIWRISGWYSGAKQDAGLTETGEISGFYEAGLHRTISEKNKMNRAQIEVMGGAAGVNIAGVCQFSVQSMLLHFKPKIALNRETPDVFQLAGGKTQIAGFYFLGEFGAVTAFGEAAFQQNHGFAFTSGLKGLFGKQKLLILYRDYSPAYLNPFANGFGEWSGTRNEKGWYIAWQFLPKRTSKFTLAADQFATPWKTFSSYLPYSGADLYFQWEQRVTRKCRFYLRYTTENKTETEKRKTAAPLLRQLTVPATKERLRFHLRISLPHDSEMSSRLETVRYALHSAGNDPLRENTETGWLLFWDFRWKPIPGLRAVSRVTLFDTPGFVSRLYQFEIDVPGILRNQLLYGRGLRFYFLINWQMGRKLRLSAKYAGTRYENRSTIGSGWDEIDSPVRHYLSLQLDVTF
ncbi:MAG TPA: hypothetical protein ENH29_05745 [Bacteroidetes bacterium]|nr:hypothetical protein [Bacteroidota bacterium]